MFKHRRFGKLTALLIAAALLVSPCAAAAAEAPVQEPGEEIVREYDDFSEPRLTPSEEKQTVSGSFGFIPDSTPVPAVREDLSYAEAMTSLSDTDEFEANSLDSPRANMPSRWPEGSDSEMLSWLGGHLPDTRNQGEFGTCWAHSIIGTMESYLLFHGLEDAGSEGPVNRDSVDYSELHLAYFTYHDAPAGPAGDGGDRVKTTQYYDNSEVNIGGNYTTGRHTLFNYIGAVDEKTAPYSWAKNGQYPEKGDARKDAVVHIRNAFRINMDTNRRLVKEAILENGAVGAAYYDDGSDGSGSGCYNESNNCYYCNMNENSNHAVMIVGWDDDFSKSRFNSYGQPYDDGAWLVRNSWEVPQASGKPAFKREQYFWISYYDKGLDSGADVFEADSAEDGFDNNYSYTQSLHGTASWTSLSGTNKFANVFRARGEKGAPSEELRAVVIETTDAEAEYKIEIYNGLYSPENPESGWIEKEATTTGTIPFAGMYTIELKNPVLIKKDNYFSVVVTMTGGAPCVESKIEFTEKDENGYETVEVSSTPGIEKGQSFAWFEGDSGWEDRVKENGGGSEYGNLAIQALTADSDKTAVDKAVITYIPVDAMMPDGRTRAAGAYVKATSSLSYNGKTHVLKGTLKRGSGKKTDDIEISVDIECDIPTDNIRVTGAGVKNTKNSSLNASVKKRPQVWAKVKAAPGASEQERYLAKALNRAFKNKNNHLYLTICPADLSDPANRVEVVRNPRDPFRIKAVYCTIDGKRLKLRKKDYVVQNLAGGQQVLEGRNNYTGTYTIPGAGSLTPLYPAAAEDIPG